MFSKTVQLRNGQTCSIREAEPDDAATLLEYVERVSGESDFLLFGAGEFQMTEDQERDLLLKWQTSERNIYLLALIDGELVGSLHFRAGVPPRTRHAGEFGMSVRRDHWGRGIGGALLDALLAWSSSHGLIGRVNLRVRTDNEVAVALYRSRGFEIEGTVRDQIRIEGKSFDFHVMGRAVGTGDGRVSP